VAEQSLAVTPSLSAQLRAQTALLHAQIDTMLGLPGAIHTRDKYLAWLERFHGLYDPSERSLAGFIEWDALGLVPSVRSHTACLTGNLAALGVSTSNVPQASGTLLPDLPSSAHALGALYVLQGATLGGRLILRDFEARIGAPIAGATRFFGGRGEAVGPMWLSFRTVLDGFGYAQPSLCVDVVTGAKRVFQTILAWIAPCPSIVVGRP
jgi:heme oxygenase (biliverdin-IX-beta and delta-forming)